MSFSEILLLKRLSVGVLSITGALVVLVGGGVVLAALSSPPDFDLNLRASADTSRSPSSIPGVTPKFVGGTGAALAKLKPTVETLALGCLRNGFQLEHRSSAKQIRLKGSLCGGASAALNTSSIVNRANGFQATLFALDAGTFSSDYISLSAGPNKLLMEIENAQGQRAVAEVTILQIQ